MVSPRVCAIGMLAAALSAGPAAGQPQAVKSRIEGVTVYRGQALVTRTVELPAQAGDLEVVVGDLPAQVVPASLTASAAGAEGVLIRSVRYRAQALAEAPEKEAAALDAEIKKASAQVQANQDMSTLLNEKRVHLEKLESFAAPTAQVELAKGVLDPKVLAQVSEYILTQRESLTQERIKLRQAGQDLQEQLGLLQRKRAELAQAGQARREAVLFLAKTGAGAATIRLNYLVGSANWSPAYNIRLDVAGEAVSIEYLAEVNQMSGEDWSGVRLTLSTATSAMNAEPPVLAPLWVGLFDPGAPQVKGLRLGKVESQDKYAEQRRNVFAGQHAYVNPSQVTGEEAGWALNAAATTLQDLELNVDRDVILAGNRALRAMEEVLAVSYALPGTMSLASRSDRQLVEIATLKLTGTVHYDAIPLLSNYVYRSAQITNTAPVPLLAGEYVAYVAGEFVGRGRLPLVARGQEFTVGCGVDTQLRCRRELTDKSDKVAWGSRVQTYQYRLLLENFKDSPVRVRVLDRVPASKSDDLKVALGRMTDELSGDAVYVRDLKDKGVLRWDVDLPAGSAGAKARELKYAFEMKFAKDKDVGGFTAGLVQEMQAEYKAMMMK